MRSIVQKIFDPIWYARKYNAALVGGDPLDHFMHAGLAAGLRPNPVFDPGWYRIQYGTSERPAVLDYLLEDRSCRRSPSALFDTDWYLSTYTDVQAAAMDALAHFVSHGRAEGRYPVRLFSDDATSPGTLEIRLPADFSVTDLDGYWPGSATPTRLLSGREPASYFSPDRLHTLVLPIQPTAELPEPAAPPHTMMCLTGGRRHVIRADRVVWPNEPETMTGHGFLMRARHRIRPVIQAGVHLLGRKLPAAGPALDELVASVASSLADFDPDMSATVLIDEFAPRAAADAIRRIVSERARVLVIEADDLIAVNRLICL